MSEMLKEFKDFILRGNVLDLAVGVVIGTAFAKIVNSLVSDVFLPPFGFLLGNVDFSNLFISLSGGDYKSLADAQAAGAATLNYGLFINNIINFLIIGFVIFLVVRYANRIFTKPQPATEATEKDCPYCFTKIPIRATRCPHCTSHFQ
jgi:large conductance mechanosensitive channel